MIPQSLIFPDNELRCASHWKALSVHLFDELCAARRAEPPASPALLWAEWKKWETFTPASAPNVVEKGIVQDWLHAYETSVTGDRANLSDYAASLVGLLGGKAINAQVPIVVAQDGRAHVLRLDIATVADGASGHWLHPAFEHRRADMSAGTGRFADALASAWAAARGFSAFNLFWHLSLPDGGPLPVMQLDGPSASAAAYRACWHLVERKVTDPDVYVLADATASDGAIKAVGHLRAKIQAIKDRHSQLSEYPPTLIAAQLVSADDRAALDAARAWAAVHQVATCAELTVVRSCESMAAIAYLNHLAETLDQCRLLPMGRRLSEVHVPPRVWKDERIRPEHETGWRDESETDAPSGPEQRDAPPKKRRVRQLWDRVFHLHLGRSPLVLVGGPGSGKSTVLHWTAREMALESVTALQARSCLPAEVSWPVLVNLDTWAAHEPSKQPRTSLISLITGAVLEEMPPHERSAITRLIEQRLTTATQQTYLFLDSLDQVASGRAVLLTKRLAALHDLTSRLVLTTRESGRHTHAEAMKTLPSPTLVESAPLTPEDTRTLAAKWLGPEQAARLERHLRSHPSLGIVADSPLLLTLACLVTSEQLDQTLPETPAALYQEMTRLLAQGRWRNGDDAPPASHDPQALLDQLPGIAWRLFVRSPGVNRFDRNTMLDAIQPNAKLKSTADSDFLDHQLVEFGFVEASAGSKTEPSYEFRHTTLLEFLAARYLANTIHLHTWNTASVDTWLDGSGWQTSNVGALIDAQAFEPSWEPVILFVAGLLKEPLPLIEMLADRRKDDLYRHRLELRLKCLEAVPGSRRPQLKTVLSQVFRELKSSGLKTVMGRPDDQKRWLEQLRIAANFALAEDELSETVLAVGHLHARTHMGGAEHMMEALQRPSTLVGARNSVAALLSLFFDSEVHMHRGHYAVEHAVRIAGEYFLSEAINALVAKRDEAGAPAWRTIIIARALLNSSDIYAANTSVDSLVAIMNDTTLEDEMWCWEAAEALLAVTGPIYEYPFDNPVREDPPHSIERRQLRERVEIILTAFLLRDNRDKYLRGVQFNFAEKVLRFMRPPITDYRSAILDVAIKRRLGADHSKAHVWWATDLLACAVPQIRRSAFNFLLDLGRADSDEGNSAVYFICREVAQLSGSEDHDEVVRLLRERFEADIKEARLKKETVKRMLEVGISFTAEIKPAMQAVIESPSADLRTVEDAAEIAKEAGDEEVVCLAIRRLLADFKPDSISPKLLFGTSFWPQAESDVLAAIRSQEGPKCAWFGINGITFGSASSVLLDLSRFLLENGIYEWRPYRRTLRELDKRGWRLRLRGRKIEVLRRGQEEPRADADFGC
jgi:hypothetical protein